MKTQVFATFALAVAFFAGTTTLASWPPSAPFDGTVLKADGGDPPPPECGVWDDCRVGSSISS